MANVAVAFADALTLDASKFRAPSRDPTYTSAIRRAFRAQASIRLARFRVLLRQYVVDQEQVTRTAMFDRAAALKAFNAVAYSSLYQTFVDNGAWGFPFLDQAYSLGIEIAKLLTPRRVEPAPTTTLFHETFKADLEGIADAVLLRFARVAADHIALKSTPSRLYSALLRELRSVAVVRTNALVNTATVKAHNWGRLDYFKAVGITAFGRVPETIDTKRTPRSLRMDARTCTCSHHHAHADADLHDISIKSIGQSIKRTVERVVEKVKETVSRITGRGRRSAVRRQELWQWVTAGDDDVCPECEDREGDWLSWEEAQAAIPLHPNCRCSVVPYGEGGVDEGDPWTPPPPRTRVKKAPPVKNEPEATRKQRINRELEQERRDKLRAERETARLDRAILAVVRREAREAAEALARARALEEERERALALAKAEEKAQRVAKLKAARQARKAAEEASERRSLGTNVTPYEKAWHEKAFTKADDEIYAVIRKAPAVSQGVKSSATNGAYYWSDRIYMGTRPSVNSAKDRVVWRHEYGHHVDYKTGLRSVEAANDMAVDAAKITSRAKQSGIDFFASDGPTMKAARATDVKELKAAINELLAGTGFRYEQIKSAVGGSSQIAQAQLAHAIKYHDAYYLLRALETSKSTKPLQPMISDLISAVTRNAVGGHGYHWAGHSDKYYHATPRIGSTSYHAGHTKEAFANYFAARGGGNDALFAILRHFTPHTFNTFDKIVREYAKP